LQQAPEIIERPCDLLSAFFALCHQSLFLFETRPQVLIKRPAFGARGHSRTALDGRIISARWRVFFNTRGADDVHYVNHNAHFFICLLDGAGEKKRSHALANDAHIFSPAAAAKELSPWEIISHSNEYCVRAPLPRVASCTRSH